MTKTRKFVTRVLPVIAVLAILVTSIVLMTGCSSDPVTVVLDNSKLALYDYRVGYISGNAENNTVDLSKAIPNAKDFAIADTTLATISGTTLTALKAGESRMTYTMLNEDGTVVDDGEGNPVVNEINIHVLDGYTNVTTWDELYTAVMVDASVANVCVQAELTAVAGKNFKFVPTDSPDYAGADPSPDTLNLYGNVLMWDTSALTTAGASVFSVEWVSKTINANDVYMRGSVPVQGEDGSVDLSQFEGGGAFFAGMGSNDVTPVFNITHCMIENSQKLISVRSSEVNLKGSVVRNGADALVAAETAAGSKGATINVENCVLANSVVSGIILWGTIADTATEQDYCTVNLNGFVDFYVWKNRETTKLMPDNDPSGFAGTVNGAIQNSITSDDYDEFFAMAPGAGEEDYADQYLNVCIIRLASGIGSIGNSSVINGAAGNDLYTDKFPLPKSLGFIIDAILKTCDLYTVAPSDVTFTDKTTWLNPTATMADNPNINYELVHGREA